MGPKRRGKTGYSNSSAKPNTGIDNVKGADVATENGVDSPPPDEAGSEDSQWDNRDDPAYQDKLTSYLQLYDSRKVADMPPDVPDESSKKSPRRGRSRSSTSWYNKEPKKPKTPLVVKGIPNIIDSFINNLSEEMISTPSEEKETESTELVIDLQQQEVPTEEREVPNEELTQTENDIDDVSDNCDNLKLQDSIVEKDSVEEMQNGHSSSKKPVTIKLRRFVKPTSDKIITKPAEPDTKELPTMKDNKKEDLEEERSSVNQLLPGVIMDDYPMETEVTDETLSNENANIDSHKKDKQIEENNFSTNQNESNLKYMATHATIKDLKIIDIKAKGRTGTEEKTSKVVEPHSNIDINKIYDTLPGVVRETESMVESNIIDRSSSSIEKPMREVSMEDSDGGKSIYRHKKFNSEKSDSKRTLDENKDGTPEKTKYKEFDESKDENFDKEPDFELDNVKNDDMDKHKSESLDKNESKNLDKDKCEDDNKSKRETLDKDENDKSEDKTTDNSSKQKKSDDEAENKSKKEDQDTSQSEKSHKHSSSRDSKSRSSKSDRRKSRSSRDKKEKSDHSSSILHKHAVEDLSKMVISKLTEETGTPLPVVTETPPPSIPEFLPFGVVAMNETSGSAPPGVIQGVNPSSKRENSDLNLQNKRTRWAENRGEDLNQQNIMDNQQMPPVNEKNFLDNQQMPPINQQNVPGPKKALSGSNQIPLGQRQFPPVPQQTLLGPQGPQHNQPGPRLSQDGPPIIGPSQPQQFPSNQQSGPRDQQFIPRNQQVRPGNQQLRPLNQQFVPGNQHIGPGNQHFGPKNQFVPGNQPIRPVHQEMGPVNQQMRPGNQQIGPGNQPIRPVHQEMGPVNQQMRPVNQQMGPGNQPIRPVHQEMGPGNQQMRPGNQQMGAGNQSTGPVNQHIGPGNQRMGPGNPQMGPGNPQMGPGNPQMGPGNPQMGPGNQQMGPGNQQMGLGNQQMELGNQQMGPGNHQMGPGNQQMGPGNQQMGPGNQQMGPGNQQLGTGNQQIGPGNEKFPSRNNQFDNGSMLNASPFPHAATDLNASNQDRVELEPPPAIPQIEGLLNESDPDSNPGANTTPVPILPVDPAQLEKETKEYYKEVANVVMEQTPDEYKPKDDSKEVAARSKLAAEIAEIASQVKPVEKEVIQQPTEDIQTAWSILHEYWTYVQENPYDFDGWTKLLNHVETLGNIEAARSAFEGFLPLYPYCFAYWKKMAELENDSSSLNQCVGILLHATKAVPFCTDLWLTLFEHFKEYVRRELLNEDVFRGFYENALEAIGLSWHSSPLWELCIEYEMAGENYLHVMNLYRRVLSVPTKVFNKHWDRFVALVRDYHPRNILSVDNFCILLQKTCEEMKKIYVPPSMVQPKAIIKVTQPEDKMITAVKEKIIAEFLKIHEKTEKEVDKRWRFETKIKRPYFHVKPLEKKQLKLWMEYLDFEIQEGDPVRTVYLFERSLVSCALYEEYWCKYAAYMEDLCKKVIKKKYANIEYNSDSFESLKDKLLSGKSVDDKENEKKKDSKDGKVKVYNPSNDASNFIVSDEFQIDLEDILKKLQSGIISGVGSRVLTCPPLTSEWVLRGVTYEDVRQIYRRGAWIHCPSKPLLLMQWAAFEESQGYVQTARDLLNTALVKVPNLLKARLQLIELERRDDQLDRVDELYEQAFKTFTESRARSCVAIRYARFLFKIKSEDEKALVVLRKALKKDRSNVHLYHQVFDICYQRKPVDVDGVLAATMLALAAKDIDTEEKYWFCVKRVDFLREHGSVAQLYEAKAEFSDFSIEREIYQSEITRKAKEEKESDLAEALKKELDEQNERKKELVPMLIPPPMFGEKSGDAPTIDERDPARKGEPMDTNQGQPIHNDQQRVNQPQNRPEHRAPPQGHPGRPGHPQNPNRDGPPDLSRIPAGTLVDLEPANKRMRPEYNICPPPWELDNQMTQYGYGARRGDVKEMQNNLNVRYDEMISKGYGRKEIEEEIQRHENVRGVCAPLNQQGGGNPGNLQGGNLPPPPMPGPMLGSMFGNDGRDPNNQGGRREDHMHRPERGGPGGGPMPLADRRGGPGLMPLPERGGPGGGGRGPMPLMGGPGGPPNLMPIPILPNPFNRDRMGGLFNQFLPNVGPPMQGGRGTSSGIDRPSHLGGNLMDMRIGERGPGFPNTNAMPFDHMGRRGDVRGGRDNLRPPFNDGMDDRNFGNMDRGEMGCGLPPNRFKIDNRQSRGGIRGRLSGPDMEGPRRPDMDRNRRPDMEGNRRPDTDPNRRPDMNRRPNTDGNRPTILERNRHEPVKAAPLIEVPNSASTDNKTGPKPSKDTPPIKNPASKSRSGSPNVEIIELTDTASPRPKAINAMGGPLNTRGPNPLNPVTQSDKGKENDPNVASLRRELTLQPSHVNVPDWFIKDGGELRLSLSNHGESFIKYWPRFLDSEAQIQLFTCLRSNIKWYQRKIYQKKEDKLVNLSKLISWIGPCDWEKDGYTLSANNTWPPELVSLLHQLIRMTGTQLNSCLLSLYRDGHDNHPWHSDDHPAMDPKPKVATIRLGEQRTFEMKSKNGLDYLKFQTQPGSLVILEGAAQQDWNQQTPKDGCDGPDRPLDVAASMTLSFRTMLMIKGVTV